MDKTRQELAQRLADKKAGVRGFPSLDKEVNLGYVTEEERDLIVVALRKEGAGAQSRDNLTMKGE